MTETTMVWKDILHDSPKTMVVIMTILGLLLVFGLTQLNPYWCFVSGSIFAMIAAIMAVNAAYTKLEDRYSEIYEYDVIIDAKISLVFVIWIAFTVVEFIVYKIFTLPVFGTVQHFDLPTILMALLSSSLPFLALSYLSTYLSYVSRLKYAIPFNAIMVLCMFIPFKPSIMVLTDQQCLLTIDTVVMAISVISIVLSLLASFFIVMKLRSLENFYRGRDRNAMIH